MSADPHVHLARSVRVIFRLLVLAVGVLWAAAAVSKLLAPADSDAWTSQFPAWAISTITLAEALIAGFIFAGWARVGLAIGLLLLLGFLATLLVSPPAPGQSCGCAGAAVIVSTPADVAAHIFAFAGLHFSAIVVVGIAPPRAHLNGAST